MNREPSRNLGIKEYYITLAINFGMTFLVSLRKAMNKGLITGLIIGAGILLIGVIAWMVMANNSQLSQSNNNQNGVANNQPATKGTLYVSFTDAAANMGNVTAVDMSVDKIYVHSQSQGWVMVPASAKTFNLLELKADAKAELMVKADVPVDTYDQVWFHVSGVKVTETGKAAVSATMPSGDFKMQGVVKVLANANSAVTLDVLADQSLHKTSKGEFIFAPVVTFEGKENTTVTVDSENMVTTAGGTVDSNTSAGMDISGEVKANFKLDATSVLQINGGVINIKSTTGITTNLGL